MTYVQKKLYIPLYKGHGGGVKPSTTYCPPGHATGVVTYDNSREWLPLFVRITKLKAVGGVQTSVSRPYASALVTN